MSTTKNFTVKEGVTKIGKTKDGKEYGGKNAIYIDTDLRLSVEDFTELIRQVKLVDGYMYSKGATINEKYYRMVFSAKTIDVKTLNSILLKFKNWSKPEPKVAKVKKDKKVSNQQAEIETLKQALAKNNEMLATMMALMAKK